MINTQLILLEGVSGSGKSFTSQLLAMQLQRNSYAADWLYENQYPHPIYNQQELDKSIAIALHEQRWHSGQAGFMDYWLRLKYRLFNFDVHEKALSNWQKLVTQTLVNGRVLVVDGGFFQAALVTLLAVEASEEKILAHCLAIEKILAPLNPVLIHLYQEDINQAIPDNFARRGAEFRDYIYARLQQTPYAHSRATLAIEQIAINYFQDYAQLISRLTKQLNLPVLAINTTASDWAACNQQIADFLAIPLLAETCEPLTPLAELAGRYQLIGADDVFEIIEEQQHLTLISPTRLRLFHKQANQFCVEGTLNECCFIADEKRMIYSMPHEKSLEFNKVMETIDGK